MKTWTIVHGSEYMRMREDGCIARPAIGMGFSDQWKITGAVRFNNFGYVVERFTLSDVLKGKITWLHKNGKQRVHLADLDHGTPRTWMSPNHKVYAD